MRRRSLLTVVASGTVLGTAGCLDDLTDQESEQDPTDGTGSDPDSSTGDQTGDSDGEDQDADSDDAQTGGERDDDREKREEIHDLYLDAIGETNTGISHLSDAVDTRSNENYSRAITNASHAQTSFENAQEILSDAIALTYEIDNRQARELCEDGEEFAGYLYDEARMHERAAEAAKDGNYELAIDYTEDAQDYGERASRVNPRDSEVMRTALDLD